MNNLIDQEVKIKKTGRKAIVVDHIDNHFALSYLDGKEVLNKTYDCGAKGYFPKKDTDHSDCNNCSYGFFHRSQLEI